MNHGLNNIQAYIQTNIDKTLVVAIPLQTLNEALEKIIEEDEEKAETLVSSLYNFKLYRKNLENICCQFLNFFISAKIHAH